MENQVAKKPSIKDALMSNMSVQQVFNMPEITNQIAGVRQKFFLQESKQAVAVAEREKFHFMKLINDSQVLQKCSKMTLYGVWMDATALNLSFDPNSKHCYVVPMGNKATLMISGPGELMLRQEAGQIRACSNPTIVWSCDKYKKKTVDSKVVYDYEQVLPRPADAVIVACFITFTLGDGSRDGFDVTAADMEYYKSFSTAKNSTAWTKGLQGMYEAKCLKHAFGAIPKPKKLSQVKFSKLESEAIDEPETIDYGIEEDGETATPVNPVTPVTNHAEKKVITVQFDDVEVIPEF